MGFEQVDSNAAIHDFSCIEASTFFVSSILPLSSHVLLTDFAPWYMQRPDHRPSDESSCMQIAAIVEVDSATGF